MTDFAAIHDELRAVARDLLGTSGGGGVDWPVLAGAGWLGLEVPEALGGSGATFAEVAVLLEEMGRAATASPYLGTVVLGAGSLTGLLADDRRDALLGGVAAGTTTVAVAVVDGDRDSGVDSAGRAVIPFAVTTTGGRSRIDGFAAFVPEATEADRLLLLARDPGGIPVVVDMAPNAPGLVIAKQPVLDATRSLGAVTATEVEVTPVSVWPFAGDAERAASALLDRGAVAVACDSLGVSEAMLGATVGYASTREQFGRPIGSFQAVKHACADMLVQVVVGRELVTAAVGAVSAADPDAGVAASRAKSYMGAAAVDIAGKAMQLHGGIGYTWESGIHVYLKRAALNRSLFGSTRAHRRRLAQRYVTQQAS